MANIVRRMGQARESAYFKIEQVMLRSLCPGLKRRCTLLMLQPRFTAHGDKVQAVVGD